MTTSTAPNLIKVLKLAALLIVVAVAGVVGYRYFTSPAQTWSADNFEARNPETITAKSQGKKAWTANTAGNGFYVTDESITPGDQQTYCVNGGVTSTSASFTLGSAALTAKNGFFTLCQKLTVNDKHQLSFSLTSGQLQIYSIERKR